MRHGSLTQFSPVARAVIVTAVLLWAFFTLFPFYWTLMTSFKQTKDIITGPSYFPWLDFSPSVAAWSDMFAGKRGNFDRNIISSAVVSITSSLVATLLGTMAAYALVRYRFRVPLGAGLAFAVIAIGGFIILSSLGLGRFASISTAFAIALAVAIYLGNIKLPGPVLGNDDIIFWFVSQRMFPPIVAAFALFLLYSEFGKLGFKMIDTYLGLTLCYTAFSLPIVIWLMRDFFSSLPVEVEEAAIVDDVPIWRIFTQIVIPMSLPGLSATFMITLAFVWNEYLFALFLTNTSWQTLPILVVAQISQRGDEWWALSTAAILALAPMVVVVWVLGRLMRSGLMLGSIK